MFPILIYLINWRCNERDVSNLRANHHTWCIATGWPHSKTHYIVLEHVISHVRHAMRPTPSTNILLQFSSIVMRLLHIIIVSQISSLTCHRHMRTGTYAYHGRQFDLLSNPPPPQNIIIIIMMFWRLRSIARRTLYHALRQTNCASLCILCAHISQYFTRLKQLSRLCANTLRAAWRENKCACALFERVQCC